MTFLCFEVVKLSLEAKEKKTTRHQRQAEVPPKAKNLEKHKSPPKRRPTETPIQ